MLFSQGLTVMATSLAAVLIARSLDPEEWGVFSALLGLSFALAIFVEFGLSTWLLRELSSLFVEQGDAAEQRARDLVSVCVCGALAVSFVVVSAGTVVTAVLGSSMSLVVAMSSLLLYGGLFALANVLEVYLRARRRLRRVVTASIVEKYLLVTLLIGVAVTSTAIWEVGVAYVVAGVVRVAMLGVSVFGRTRPTLPRLDDVRVVWKKSLPFALTSGAITVIPRFDTLVLVALSATAAGYFAIGERILGPAVALAVMGATTLYPFLARRTHSVRAIWGLSLTFGACGAVLATIGFVSAPTLVPLVFGQQYEDAVPVVQVMLLALPLLFASNPLLVYGFSCGRERAILVATIGAALTGTCAIVAGQLVAGAPGAAAGLFFREVLLLVAVGSIAATTAQSHIDSSRPPVSPTVQAPIG